MEKIIKIDGRDIKFKSTGATPIKYKRQFGRDFFADIFKLDSLTKVAKGKSNKAIEQLDMDVFYNIAWVLAKGAEDIPPLEEWLESFESFPILEIITELNELLIASIKSKKK